MPSYEIKIYLTNGKNQSGIRYTDLKSIPEIQNAVREKMRQAGKLGMIAYIHVKPSIKPAEKNL